MKKAILLAVMVVIASNFTTHHTTAQEKGTVEEYRARVRGQQLLQGARPKTTMDSLEKKISSLEKTIAALDKRVKALEGKAMEKQDGQTQK